MTKKDLIDYRNNEEFIEILIRKYKKKLAIYEGLREFCTNQVIDELVKAHNKMVDALVKQQQRQDKILEIIQKIENTNQRNTLFKYFVEGQSLKDISIEIDIDYSCVRKYNMEAIKEFERIGKNID